MQACVNRENVYLPNMASRVGNNDIFPPLQTPLQTPAHFYLSFKMLFSWPVLLALVAAIVGTIVVFARAHPPRPLAPPLKATAAATPAKVVTPSTTTATAAPAPVAAAIFPMPVRLADDDKPKNMATTPKEKFEEGLREFVSKELPRYAGDIAPRVLAFLYAAAADLKESYAKEKNLTSNPVGLMLDEWRNFAKDLGNPLQSTYSSCRKLNSLQDVSGVRTAVKENVGIFRLTFSGGDLLAVHASDDPSTLQVNWSRFAGVADNVSNSAISASTVVQLPVDGKYTGAQKKFVEELNAFSLRMHKLRDYIAPNASRLLRQTLVSISTSFDEQMNLTSNPVQSVLDTLKRALDDLLNPLITLHQALSAVNDLQQRRGINHGALHAHFGQVRLINQSGVDVLGPLRASSLHLTYPGADNARYAPGSPTKTMHGRIEASLVGSPGP
jgi:hypothetical protein